MAVPDDRFTRRSFLAFGGVILIGSAGCSEDDVEQIELTIINFVDEKRDIVIRLETLDEEIVLDRRFDLGGERLERVEIPERRLRTVHVEADGFSESVSYDPPRQCRRGHQRTLLVAVDADEVYLTYGCESQ